MPKRADQAPLGGGRDRRRFTRSAVRVAITFASESNLYAGFTDNISEGGVFVATHQLLPLGSEVDLEVSFEAVGGPVIRTRGEVRWVRDTATTRDVEPGMGVSYLDLAAGQRRWLQAFIKKRDPLFFDDDAPARPGRPTQPWEVRSEPTLDGAPTRDERMGAPSGLPEPPPARMPRRAERIRPRRRPHRFSVALVLTAVAVAALLAAGIVVYLSRGG